VKIKNLHSWSVTPKEAVQIQHELKHRLVHHRINTQVDLIAGADAAYDKKAGAVYAAIVVLMAKDMEVVESCWAKDNTAFPYVPGLLTFREGPALLRALEKLKLRPDVILFDGQGIAHPRSMGIAAHIGLHIDVPTIGCAKSRLVGEFIYPDQEVGSCSPLVHKGKIIGAALRTRNGVKPLFISPGNRIDLQSSLAIILQSSKKYRIPEPIRKAHGICGEIKDTNSGNL
jgi:deoxyribonuclease V